MNKRRDDDPSAIFSRGGKARPVRPRPGGQGPVGRGPRDFTPAEPQEEEFRQPNPSNPVAGAKPGVVIGVALMLSGIVALVVFPFLPVSFPGWTTPALIAAIVLGIAILFLQMPAKRSGSGDGAQV